MKREEFCWASGDKKCTGGITKEHVISDSILRCMNGGINISDSGINKFFGAKSFVIRNLCQYHNEKLSSSDAEALKFFKTYHNHIHDKNSVIKNVTHVNGHLLERWFAKTMINTCIFRWKAIKPKNQPFSLSIHSVYKNIFEGEQFKKPFGLYLIEHKNRIKPQGSGLQLYPVFIDVMGKNQEETQFAMDCPIMMRAGLLGFEIVGYFNITNLSDNQFIDYISHGVLKKHIDTNWYRPSMIGTTNPNDHEAPKGYPSRVIEIDW
jgi:hypothetical protein